MEIELAHPELLQLAEAKAGEVHGLYKDLHANPELSMQEHRTSALIRTRLEGLGLEVVECGGTGVVGVLRNGEGPVVAYRADFDGLPIAEATGLDYASTATGTLPDGSEVPVMHGCGHDFHVSVALAAVAALLDIRDQWAGTIVFIFQPGEELAAGALAMVADGLWERVPRPEVIYAQHVTADEAGTLRVPVGPALAMSDSWKVLVHGRGGHGSQPQETIDPIMLAINMVVRIQQIVSREVGPQENAVITVGTFNAGLKENIIPDRAEFSLNVRTFTPAVREQVLSSLRRIIMGEALISEAQEPVITELNRAPECHNDPTEATALIAGLRTVMGDERVLQTPPIMASEDFGYFPASIGVPSVYWSFGGQPAELLASGGPVPGNHSPHFAPVIEPTMSTGVQGAVVALLSKLRR